MCIAIIKPKDKHISDEALKNCYERNPDGAGLAFAKNGKLYIMKGIFNKDEFVKAVQYYEKEQEGAMLIHCRIGTSGLKDKENCHPHVINNKLVMIHNGIIRIDVPANSKVSDTVIFAQEYLRSLPDNFIKNPYIMKLIQMAIGSNNKLAFLNEKGEYAIVNENQGVWDDGVWYSNETYKTPKITYNYGWNSDYEYNYMDIYGNKYTNYLDKLRSNKKAMENNNDNVVNKLADNKELSKNRIKKLKKRIRNLSDKKMLEIGEYPLWDKVNQDFSPYRPSYNTNQYMELDEYCSELYEEWMYEYDERFGQVPSMKTAI